MWTTPNTLGQCADRECSRLRVRGTTLQPQEKEPGQRDTTKNHGRLGGICQTLGYVQSNFVIFLKRKVYNSTTAPLRLPDDDDDDDDDDDGDDDDNTH